MLSRLQHDLRAYWPRYLAHHTHRKNRALHDLGDLAVLTGALTFNPVLAAAGVGAGYSFAFAGHFLIEGRKPATLEHPVLAGLSNWRMFALGCTGGLEEELARYELESEGEANFGMEHWRACLLAWREQKPGTAAARFLVALYAVSTSPPMPRYREYLVALDAQRPTLVSHRERGDGLIDSVFRSTRGEVFRVGDVSAFDLLAALSSFTDDYAIEPPRLFAVDVAVSILERIRGEHCLSLWEQLEIALRCAEGRPFEALLGLHTATRVLARGRDARLHPAFRMSLEERLHHGEAIAPFHPDDALGGDPLGDTYHFWANVTAGVYAACPTNPKASRAMVYAMLYAGPWLMHGVRETLFGSTLFCGTHSRIDRLGLSLGWRLGRA
ncbi:MAG: Mpo1-like protein [Polyangiales bacterium]